MEVLRNPGIETDGIIVDPEDSQASKLLEDGHTVLSTGASRNVKYKKLSEANERVYSCLDCYADKTCVLCCTRLQHCNHLGPEHVIFYWLSAGTG